MSIRIILIYKSAGVCPGPRQTLNGGTTQVVVLIGGVIGVCSAVYLAKEGADVVVLEPNPEVAMGTSHVNAWQIPLEYSTLDGAHLTAEALELIAAL